MVRGKHVLGAPVPRWDSITWAIVSGPHGLGADHWRVEEVRATDRGRASLTGLLEWAGVYRAKALAYGNVEAAKNPRILYARRLRPVTVESRIVGVPEGTQPGEVFIARGMRAEREILIYTEIDVRVTLSLFAPAREPRGEVIPMVAGGAA